MVKSELAGKAQTVLGAIEGKDLGVTFPHEHLLFDGRGSFFIEPAEASGRGLAYKPVTLEITNWLRYHPFENLDNVTALDEQEATDEATTLKKAGGNTIVDLTMSYTGRDPKALARISRATGLNVIMASGYYLGSCHPADMDSKTEQDITDEIVHDITIGVGDTGIKSGIIGEIGCTWPLQDNERKVLRAAARAQQLTGAPINTHPGRKEEAPYEIVESLADAGADLNRVIMSHVDIRTHSHSERCKIAKTGCCIEYDAFGWEGVCRVSSNPDLFADLPNDTQRVYDILQLIEDGYLNQILISQDTFIKSHRQRWGGWGLVHIINYVVPLMLKKGMTNEQINTIMVENPKRMLSFV